MSENNQIIPIQPIENKIYIFRGQKVMTDSDLAELYRVETKVLNQAVKRNSARFPVDFMFRLSKDENKSLRSQIVTSNKDEYLKSQNATSNEDQSLRSQNVTLNDNRGKHRKYMPYVFTEHGTVMLASVLKSKTAIDASIQIVKAFVKFRELLISQDSLAGKIDELENKYDAQFKQVFTAIRQLMTNQPLINTIKKGRKD